MANISLKEALATLRASLKKYIDDIASKKVDKKDGYSLISDSEINRLKDVTNYDDSRIQAVLDRKIEYIPAEYIDESELTGVLSSYSKSGHTHSQYATTSYVTSQLANVTSGSNIPSYVVTEAQMVADKVIEKRNAYSLVISSMSDLHTTGTDTSATGVLHAFQGINEIDKLTPVDLVAIHGDVIVVKMDDTYKDGLRYVRSCMNEVTKNIPLVQMQGNHDELSSDTTEEGRQKYFRYIGANNEGTTTDFSNRFRNYGYKDFDDLRIRVIYLNSADCSDGDVTTDCWITSAQYNWFINKALNFSSKEEPNDWHFIVMNHHPLNWNSHMVYLQNILKAHKSRTSGSFTHNDGETISYDFTNTTQNLVCHIHGHVHNFRTDWYDDVLSITVPNACYGRNNEYGTYSGYSDQVHQDFGDIDENGNQRQFNKTSGTAEDTAFVTLVIDSRVNNMIYAYCYGAGIHREIDLTTKEITYIEKATTDDGGDTGEETPTIPDEVTQYTNLVPTSIDSDGSVYNSKGYADDSYISSSTGLPSTYAGYVTTGYMELPNTFYIYGATMDIADSYCRFCGYDDTFTKQFVVPAISYADYFTVTDMGNGIQKIDIIATALQNCKYYRLSLKGTGTNLYVYSMNNASGGGTGNLLPKAIDSDGSIFNSIGYKVGWRLSGDTGLAKESTGFTLTGFIPWTQGDVVRIANVSLDSTEGYIWTYKEDFTPLYVVDNSTLGLIEGATSLVWDNITSSIYKDAKYMRIALKTTFTNETIITVNEEIPVIE